MSGGQYQVAEGAAPGSPGGISGSIYYNSVTQRLEFIDKNGNISFMSGGITNQNLISNSSFKYWQRQTPGSYANPTSSSTARTYGNQDRWAGTVQNGTLGVRRIDTSASPLTGLNSRFYADYIKNTGSGKIAISTALSGQQSYPLRGRTVWFGFKAALGAGTDWTNLKFGLTSYAGTMDSTAVTYLTSFGSTTNDMSLAANYTYAVPLAVPIGGTITSAQSVLVTTSATWTQFGALFTVPTGCRNLVPCIWSQDQVGANNTIFIAEPVLADATTQVLWTPPNDAQEYLDCARYYQKTFAIDTVPLANIGNGTGEFRFPASLVGALAERAPTYVFPVRMRATPTTTTRYNPNAANTEVRDITNAVDCSASASTSTDAGCFITATGNAATTVGAHLGVHLSFDAEIM